jgi:hypothetical protein
MTINGSHQNPRSRLWYCAWRLVNHTPRNLRGCPITATKRYRRSTGPSGSSIVYDQPQDVAAACNETRCDGSGTRSGECEWNVWETWREGHNARACIIENDTIPYVGSVQLQYYPVICRQVEEVEGNVDGVSGQQEC